MIMYRFQLIQIEKLTDSTLQTVPIRLLILGYIPETAVVSTLAVRAVGGFSVRRILNQVEKLQDPEEMPMEEPASLRGILEEVALQGLRLRVALREQLPL